MKTYKVVLCGDDYIGEAIVKLDRITNEHADAVRRKLLNVEPLDMLDIMLLRQAGVKIEIERED